MASKKVNIDISTKADIAGAKQAAGAMDGLATATNKASTATGNVGNLAAQAGYQVQDFATQVSMGTSAFTAFAQQAPQLLGAFGPKGAIIGALVAVGAIIAKITYEIVTGAGDAEEALEKTIEATEEIQDKLIKLYETRGGDKAKAAIAAIEQESKLSNILRENELDLIDVKNQRIKTDESLAKKQDDLIQKAVSYLAQIGQIANAEVALDELRKQAAEREKQAAIAGIEAGVQSQIARYNNLKNQRDDLDAEVRNAEERIAVLQKRQQELTAQANITRASDERLIKMGLEKEGYRSPATAESEGRLKSLETQISQLSDFLKETPVKIANLTAQAYEQGGKIDAAMESAKIEIEKIESEYKLTEKSQAITEASQKMSGAAQAISTAIEGFEPINQAQEKAKAQLLQAAADGQITANEQQQVAASLNTLMGTLRAGQNTSISTLQELIKINNDLASKLGKANDAISGLRAKVNALFIPTR